MASGWWWTWTWSAGMPQSVIERCTWWSRALCKVPVNVHETYSVDHASGSIRVKDAFDYRQTENDWKTEPLTIAPLRRRAA